MRAVTQVRLSADYDMTNHGHSNRAKAEVANGRVRSLFPENRIESDGTDLGADGTGGSRQPPRCGGGGCYVSASARFPAPALDCRQSRLQNSLGCGLNSRFPGEHSVVLDCRLRVLGREDSSGEPRCVERRPSTCLHRHRWMTGPGRAPALDRRLADDTLFVTSPGARAGRRSAPARRTCSGTSPSRRRGRGHGDRRTRP